MLPPRSPHHLVCVSRKEVMNSKREVTAPGNTRQMPHRHPNSLPMSQQKTTQSPDKAQRDMEIIRKVFAACDER
jgi:hypothetical protein